MNKTKFNYPNEHYSRKTIGGRVYRYTFEKINIENLFAGEWSSPESILKDFPRLFNAELEIIHKNLPSQELLFRFEQEEDYAKLAIITVRDETERERQIRRKKSAGAKLAAKQHKLNIEAQERKTLAQLSKKYGMDSGTHD